MYLDYLDQLLEVLEKTGYDKDVADETVIQIQHLYREGDNKLYNKYLNRYLSIRDEQKEKNRGWQ